MTLFSTAATTVTLAGASPIPGLNATVDTLASSVLFISTEGGILNNGQFPGDYVQVGVRVLVDDFVVAEHSYDLERGSFATKDNWHLSLTVSLAAGRHTIIVQGRLRDAQTLNVATPDATLGGTNGSVMRGTLTVLTLNK